MTKKIKHISKECSLLGVMAVLVFVIPIWTSLIIGSYVTYKLYKKSGWQKAFILGGITLILIVLDNFVQGRQDYLRAVTWAYQFILMYEYYKNKE